MVGIRLCTSEWVEALRRPLRLLAPKGSWARGPRRVDREPQVRLPRPLVEHRAWVALAVREQLEG